MLEVRKYTSTIYYYSDKFVSFNSYIIVDSKTPKGEYRFKEITWANVENLFQDYRFSNFDLGFKIEKKKYGELKLNFTLVPPRYPLNYFRSFYKEDGKRLFLFAEVSDEKVERFPSDYVLDKLAELSPELVKRYYNERN